jgi:hypothetical protein
MSTVQMTDHQGNKVSLSIPYGYNSHRSRLGRDNRPELFRKTNIANDVAVTLHPVVGRSGPDTIDLFPFLTLSNFRVFFWDRQRVCDALRA